MPSPARGSPFHSLDMRNALPDFAAGLLELVFPPADLLTPVAECPVSLDVVGRACSVQYEHRYKGPHVLGIRVRGLIPMPVKTYDWGGRYLAIFKSHLGPSIERRLDDSPNPWWGHSSNGFELLKYSVPADLPLRGTIECELQVLDAGHGVPSEYGALTLYVGRFVGK